MKKLLSLVLVLILLLTSLSSCFARYKENRWFPDEILEECLVPELPNLGDEFTVLEANADIYSCLSSAEYNSYVSAVYEYLKAQSFKYLGTRGEQKGTLAGAFTTYYFKPASELEEFYTDGHYRFVYSDGVKDESGDITFYIIGIYYYPDSFYTLEYNGKEFSYNTQISVSKNHEAPMGGFYMLELYDINYEGDLLDSMLLEGYAPVSASPYEEVVIRTHPIMDADLNIYFNGHKAEQTYADSDYWEYRFTMPDEDVTITYDIVGGM